MKIHLQKAMLLIAVFIAVGSSTFGQGQAQIMKPLNSGYAPVNGLKIYYEVYGQGEPLVLIHGAFMTIGMNWGQLIPAFAKTRKVITLEMQGHGHTAYSDRELTYPTLASDVAGVMKLLKIDSADVIGYSFGGTIAYQLAIQNPELVKKLIIISSTYKTEGWQKEVRDVLKIMQPAFLDDTPLKTEYVKVAPDSFNWHKYVAKMMAFDNTNYNLGDEKIKSIKVPVLLVNGDNDGVDKAVLMNTYQLLGGCVFGDMNPMPKSLLAIIPGKTHTSLMMDKEAIFSTVSRFIK